MQKASTSRTCSVLSLPMHQTIFSVSHFSLPSCSMQTLLLSTRETHLCCVSYITYFDTESFATITVDTWFSSWPPIAIYTSAWFPGCMIVISTQTNVSYNNPGLFHAPQGLQLLPADQLNCFHHVSLYNSASHVSKILTEHTCPWPKHKANVSCICAPILTDYMHLPVPLTCFRFTFNSQPAFMLCMHVWPLARLASLKLRGR